MELQASSCNLHSSFMASWSKLWASSQAATRFVLCLVSASIMVRSALFRLASRHMSSTATDLAVACASAFFFSFCSFRACAWVSKLIIHSASASFSTAFAFSMSSATVSSFEFVLVGWAPSRTEIRSASRRHWPRSSRPWASSSKSFRSSSLLMSMRCRLPAIIVCSSPCRHSTPLNFHSRVSPRRCFVFACGFRHSFLKALLPSSSDATRPSSSCRATQSSWVSKVSRFSSFRVFLSSSCRNPTALLKERFFAASSCARCSFWAAYQAAFSAGSMFLRHSRASLALVRRSFCWSLSTTPSFAFCVERTNHLSVDMQPKQFLRKGLRPLAQDSARAVGCWHF